LLTLELVLLLGGRHEDGSGDRRLDRENQGKPTEPAIVEVRGPGGRVPGHPAPAKDTENDQKEASDPNLRVEPDDPHGTLTMHEQREGRDDHQRSGPEHSLAPRYRV